MRSRLKREAEKRARLFIYLTTARIVAEITIIIGIFIFIYFVIKVFL
jgi:hypothetical protein|tara:strand:+ start:586 stop:726 length:141 start_codon:yes stop_codon:yes gene_type:complete